MNEPGREPGRPPRPFAIRIFVAEGLPDGLRLVEKSNWVGLGLVCPRGRYPRVKSREEFGRSGVYLLVGREGEGEPPTLYIGEAETVRTRLDSHHANKDFWSQAIVFTTKGDPLNKAEVKYLEARLVELAKRYKKCRLDNGNDPARPGLSEPDQAIVEGYLDEMLSLLPILGIDAFEPTRAASPRRRLFYLKGKEWDATGYETSSGFAVKEGSRTRGKNVRSMSSYRGLRERLAQEGVLVPDGAGYRFVVDYEFPAPSPAGAVVTGRNTNGREAWKDAQGVSLKEHQQREAEAS